MKPLNQRQSAFVQAYIQHGVASRAAIEAGYSEKTAYSQAERLLRNVGIRAEIERLGKKTESAAVADAAERREFWTSVMRDSDGDMKDRLKASELLGRTGGDFIERSESSGTLIVRVVRE